MGPHMCNFEVQCSQGPEIQYGAFKLQAWGSLGIDCPDDFNGACAASGCVGIDVALGIANVPFDIDFAAVGVCFATNPMGHCHDTRSGDTGGGRCSNTCSYASDNDCNDGGQGNEYSLCDHGTDCHDCGSRDADECWVDYCNAHQDQRQAIAVLKRRQSRAFGQQTMPLPTLHTRSDV